MIHVGLAVMAFIVGCMVFGIMLDAIGLPIWLDSIIALAIAFGLAHLSLKFYFWMVV